MSIHCTPAWGNTTHTHTHTVSHILFNDMLLCKNAQRKDTYVWLYHVSLYFNETIIFQLLFFFQYFTHPPAQCSLCPEWKWNWKNRLLTYSTLNVSVGGIHSVVCHLIDDDLNWNKMSYDMTCCIMSNIIAVQRQSVSTLLWLVHRRSPGMQIHFHNCMGWCELSCLNHDIQNTVKYCSVIFWGDTLFIGSVHPN